MTEKVWISLSPSPPSEKLRERKEIIVFLTSIRTRVRRIQNDTSPALSTPSSLSLNFYFLFPLPCISLLNNFSLNSLSFLFFSLGKFLHFPSLQHRSIKTRPEETRTSWKITQKNYALLQIRIATLHSGKMQQNGKLSHISNAIYDAESLSEKAKPTLNNHIKFFLI